MDADASRAKAMVLMVTSLVKATAWSRLAAMAERLDMEKRWKNERCAGGIWREWFGGREWSNEFALRISELRVPHPSRLYRDGWGRTMFTCRERPARFNLH